MMLYVGWFLFFINAEHFLSHLKLNLNIYNKNIVERCTKHPLDLPISVFQILRNVNKNTIEMNPQLNNEKKSYLQITCYH